MNKESESMKFQLIVSTPVGVELVTNTYYRGCEVVIGKVKTSANPVKLGDMEYDLILGMHCLSTYHAHVDCYQKRMIFKLERGPEYVLDGMKNKINIPIILVIKPPNY